MNIALHPIENERQKSRGHVNEKETVEIAGCSFEANLFILVWHCYLKYLLSSYVTVKLFLLEGV